jgi:hypothetical protein
VVAHWLIEHYAYHWGPVILTLARFGSPGPGRFPYSHCGWVPLRPSDSDFSQNWKPGTGEIPLLSLWLGAIEHWGPVILTSARFGSPGPGKFPYSHCGWVSLRPSDSDFGQIWKPRTGEILLFEWSQGDFLGTWIKGNPHTIPPLINQSSCTGEHVEMGYDHDSNPGSFMGRTS